VYVEIEKIRLLTKMVAYDLRL